jgi:hypothetical protein
MSRRAAVKSGAAARVAGGDWKASAQSGVAMQLASMTREIRCILMAGLDSRADQ